MIIQILGTGCAKCLKLEQNTREAVKSIGLDCTIEKITDLQKIMSYGIMSTPGIVINGKVVASGRLINQLEIIKLIEENK